MASLKPRRRHTDIRKAGAMPDFLDEYRRHHTRADGDPHEIYDPVPFSLYQGTYDNLYKPDVGDARRGKPDVTEIPEVGAKDRIGELSHLRKASRHLTPPR